MTQDEIIAMAKVAGFDIGIWEKLDDQDTFFGYSIGGIHENLECFAKLIAEKATEEANARANASWTLMCEKMVAFEREACAKVAENRLLLDASEVEKIAHYTACKNIANEIRARGNA